MKADMTKKTKKLSKDKFVLIFSKGGSLCRSVGVLRVVKSVNVR